jgi:hypothetical protein
MGFVIESVSLVTLLICALISVGLRGSTIYITVDNRSLVGTTSFY